MTSPMNDRLFPSRPILAVSAAVFRRGRVLIVRRARRRSSAISACRAGGWKWARRSPRRSPANSWRRSGFRLKSSASTGMSRRSSPRGADSAHFVIASFVARWTGGEPRLSDEVDAVDWIDPALAPPSPATPELAEVLKGAARIESEHE